MKRARDMETGPFRQGDFRFNWRKVPDGFLADTAYQPSAAGKASGFGQNLPAQNDALEIVFRPDYNLYDGRFANVGWLRYNPMISPGTLRRR